MNHENTPEIFDESVGAVEFTIKVTQPKFGLTNEDYARMLHAFKLYFDATAVEQKDFRLIWRYGQNHIEKIVTDNLCLETNQPSTLVIFTDKTGACSGCGNTWNHWGTNA